MITAEHRKPLAAFVVVLAVAGLIIANGLRTQVVDVLIRADAPRQLIGALAPDLVLGQSLSLAPQTQPQARPAAPQPAAPQAPPDTATAAATTGDVTRTTVEPMAAAQVVASKPRPKKATGQHGRPPASAPAAAPAAPLVPAATPTPAPTAPAPTTKPVPAPAAPGYWGDRPGRGDRDGRRDRDRRDPRPDRDRGGKARGPGHASLPEKPRAHQSRGDAGHDRSSRQDRQHRDQDRHDRRDRSDRADRGDRGQARTADPRRDGGHGDERRDHGSSRSRHGR